MLCPSCQKEVSSSETDPLVELHCAYCDTRFPLAAADTEVLESGPTVAERYELIERVGAGGFGEVWKARDSRLNRTVAVKKLLNERAGANEVDLLLHEARAMAGLHHPNIVAVYDSAEDENGGYLVCSYVEGESLAKWMKSNSPDLGESTSILTGIARGLQHAHEAGIIHRDLKPKNVLLDESLTPYVADFGLAKNAVSSTIMESGEIVGTLAYMSPEQASGDGHSADARSDIFSFGVLAYELLAGRLPFNGKNSHEMLASIINQDFPPFGKESSVPQWLATIVDRCLQKQPSERYQSAQELVADLEANGTSSSLARDHDSKRSVVTQRFGSLRLAHTIVLGLLLLGLVFVGPRLLGPFSRQSRKVPAQTLTNKNDKKMALAERIIAVGKRFEDIDDKWHEEMPVDDNFEFSYIEADSDQIGDSLLFLIGELKPKRLSGIGLSYTKITDRGIAELAKIDSLDSVNIRGTDVGDEGLKHLASLPRLDTLNLAGTKVTTKGIESLRGHKRLSDLNLKATALNDTAIEVLSSIRKLSELDLSDTNISYSALENLASSLPDVKIYVYKNRSATTDEWERLLQRWPNRIIDKSTLD